VLPRVTTRQLCESHTDNTFDYQALPPIPRSVAPILTPGTIELAPSTTNDHRPEIIIPATHTAPRVQLGSAGDGFTRLVVTLDGR
jgi:hypothetical protein